MSEVKITDPNLATLLQLAGERAETIGGRSGQIISAQALACARELQTLLNTPPKAPPKPPKKKATP